MERPAGELTGHPLLDLIAHAIQDNRPIWFDTPAVIAYLQDDNPFSGIVGPMLEHPMVPKGISTITLADVLTGPALSGDRELLRQIDAGIRKLPNLRIGAFGASEAAETAFVRAETGLKVPDAAIIASARAAGAVGIIGNDRRWNARPLGLPYIHLADLVGERPPP